jgi:hypothetical protein
VNDPLEHRLRDLFGAIDAQVTPQPLLVAPARDRRRVSLPLTAARVMIAMAGVAALVVLVMRNAEPRVEVSVQPLTTIDAGVFDERAADLCRSFEVDRNGVAPVFATPEAYITVVEARREVIAAFIDRLAGLTPPDDAPGLPTSVVADLGAASALLDDVERLARAGQLEDAASTWREVDPRIDASIAPLGAHGAAACNQGGH